MTKKRNPELDAAKVARVERNREAMARSASRAGIGKIYHSRSLKEFGSAGKSILKDMDDAAYFSGFIRDGGGYTIEAKTQEGYALPFVLGKAMRMMHIDCRVIGLLPLIEYAERQNTDEDADTRVFEFENAQALIIPRFFEDTDERPVTRREVYRLENYLTGRMDEGFSVSIQYSGNLGKQAWFSDYFLKRVLSKNKEVKL